MVLAEVIDLHLYRTSLGHLDQLLDTRGLAHFLRRGGGPPWLDEERVRGVLEFAIGQLSWVPVPSALEPCYRAIRRRLIAHLATAMVHAGY